jgi:hypothetical protein
MEEAASSKLVTHFNHLLSVYSWEFGGKKEKNRERRKEVLVEEMKSMNNNKVQEIKYKKNLIRESIFYIWNSSVVIFFKNCLE